MVHPGDTYSDGLWANSSCRYTAHLGGGSECTLLCRRYSLVCIAASVHDTDHTIVADEVCPLLPLRSVDDFAENWVD